MKPIQFEQANSKMGPPDELVESQCGTVATFKTQIVGGSCDGLPLCVVAWRPDESDIHTLVKGGVVFVSVIGGLPPHFLTTDFHSATHPA